MRRNINFIEVIIILCVIVILVKGLSYKKSSKEIPTPMPTPEQITTQTTPEKVRTQIATPKSNIPTNNLSADFWFKKGNALYDQDKYEEAIICYDKAIEIEPEHYKAWHNKGLSLHNQDKYEEAIICYDKVLQIKPEYFKAWFNGGLSLECGR